jgi:hypothetical protein
MDNLLSESHAQLSKKQGIRAAHTHTHNIWEKISVLLMVLLRERMMDEETTQLILFFSAPRRCSSLSFHFNSEI